MSEIKDNIVWFALIRAMSVRSSNPEVIRNIVQRKAHLHTCMVTAVLTRTCGFIYECTPEGWKFFGTVVTLNGNISQVITRDKKYDGKKFLNKVELQYGRQ